MRLVYHTFEKASAIATPTSGTCLAISPPPFDSTRSAGPMARAPLCMVRTFGCLSAVEPLNTQHPLIKRCPYRCPWCPYWCRQVRRVLAHFASNCIETAGRKGRRPELNRRPQGFGPSRVADATDCLHMVCISAISSLAEVRPEGFEPPTIGSENRGPVAATTKWRKALAIDANSGCPEWCRRVCTNLHRRDAECVAIHATCQAGIVGDDPTIAASLPLTAVSR